MRIANLYKANWFKYLKNLIIGIGAALVMIGALGKINSEPWGDLAITVGLTTEAIIFTLLGIIPPEKEFYWEKLYPGLDRYTSRISPLIEGDIPQQIKPLNGEVVEGQLGGMLGELQTMSKSLSSLKALQEVDFSQTSDQIKAMGNFYERMNEAMQELSGTVEDTKTYRYNLNLLNENITGVNQVYQGVISSREHIEKINDAMQELGSTVEEARTYKEQINSLNNNLESLNSVYGNVLSAFTAKG
jgi:hypothetical protein